MKLFILLLTCFLLGCSSQNSGYKKITASASEAAALSSLSETLKVGSSDGQDNADNQVSTSSGSKKITVPGFTK